MEGSLSQPFKEDRSSHPEKVKRWLCVYLQGVCAQSCLTPCDSMDCSWPGSCSWNSPGKNTGVGCHFLLHDLQGYKVILICHSDTMLFFSF